MRILKLAGVALVFVAIITVWIVGDRSRISELQTLQAPAAETVEPTPDPNATPTPTPTLEPTGIDTVAPQILSIDLVQSRVDTTASSQPLTATVHITDDLSGLQHAILRFVPVAGGTQYLEFNVIEGHRVSGDRQDGVYVAAARLPKYAAHGLWYLSEITVIDNANNGKQSYVPVIEDAVEAAVEPIHFLNGDDEEGVVQLPPPVDPSEADATPWANELRLPVVVE